MPRSGSETLKLPLVSAPKFLKLARMGTSERVRAAGQKSGPPPGMSLPQGPSARHHTRKRERTTETTENVQRTEKRAHCEICGPFLWPTSQHMARGAPDRRKVCPILTGGTQLKWPEVDRTAARLEAPTPPGPPTTPAAMTLRERTSSPVCPRCLHRDPCPRSPPSLSRRSPSIQGPRGVQCGGKATPTAATGHRERALRMRLRCTRNATHKGGQRLRSVCLAKSAAH